MGINRESSESKSSFFLKLWSFCFLIFAVLVLLTTLWYNQKLQSFIDKSPFLKVSNRDISLFLWQFSDYMPQHVKNKNGYLPGFEYTNRIGIVFGEADRYCHAPPELLFLYHTWDRLLKKEFVERTIPISEFLSFLEMHPEWKFENWPKAPKAYSRYLKSLEEKERVDNDLSKDSYTMFPLEVRQAFQGWKNYTIEGEEINNVRFTIAEVQDFIERHPGYSINLWSNISSFSLNPSNFKLPPFVKLALYNDRCSERQKLE